MPGRQRRAGGGRKRLEDKDPDLRAALRGLAEAATRGDPMAEVTWCSLSLRELERQMAALGFWCGKDAIARMLRAGRATACRRWRRCWRGSSTRAAMISSGTSTR